jgi:hypothetical protein
MEMLFRRFQRDPRRFLKGELRGYVRSNIVILAHALTGLLSCCSLAVLLIPRAILLLGRTMASTLSSHLVCAWQRCRYSQRPAATVIDPGFRPLSAPIMRALSRSVYRTTIAVPTRIRAAEHQRALADVNSSQEDPRPFAVISRGKQGIIDDAAPHSSYSSMDENYSFISSDFSEPEPPPADPPQNLPLVHIDVSTSLTALSLRSMPPAMPVVALLSVPDLALSVMQCVGTRLLDPLRFPRQFMCLCLASKSWEQSTRSMYHQIARPFRERVGKAVLKMHFTTLQYFLRYYRVCANAFCRNGIQFRAVLKRPEIWAIVSFHSDPDGFVSPLATFSALCDHGCRTLYMRQVLRRARQVSVTHVHKILSSDPQVRKGALLPLPVSNMAMIYPDTSHFAALWFMVGSLVLAR